MPITSEQLKKFPADIFVETGSFHGAGIQAALDAGCFKDIYSIELSDQWYNHCKEKFRGKANVHCILGNSGIMLYSLLKGLESCKGSFTFWLDGHDSGPGTARGDKETPLLEEIEAIRLFRPDATILIDDLRGWKLKEHGFDRHYLKDILIGVNASYRFFEIDGYAPRDILVATV